MDFRQRFGKLLSDIDFMDVDMRMKMANVFTLFHMEYVEAKHSTFVAWLLDPNADHGMEDLFLKRFLAAALASPPQDANEPLPEVSPIPYQAVQERLLTWDRLDVLSADLRDTNVSTDIRRRSDGGKIDICLWNNSYNLAVYVENNVEPKHTWRLRHGPPRPKREHQSERYLLDLYSQWGADDAGSYDILPIFLSFGNLSPGETRVFRHLNYSWMPLFLRRLLESGTVNQQAQPHIRAFCDWLDLELPSDLAPDLYDRLVNLTNRYGDVLCRLMEHVFQCTGCEEDDILSAFHDVYRRHGATVSYLASFVESTADEHIEAVAKQLRSKLSEQHIEFYQGPASLSASSTKWTSLGGPHNAMEVSLGTRCLSCGVTIYSESLTGKLNRLLASAEKLSNKFGVEIVELTRMRRNFRLVHQTFDTFDQDKMVDAFITCFHFADAVAKSLS
ncbi:MAG: PD-(D/E)XK nuclease family protein [Deltaproteobacteria bacterium]|nr:PD-(D/E)XK nuclease family protein [Deltaproteobacteria bacterium]